MQWAKSLTLQYDTYTLEPLSYDHHDGLVETVQDGELSKLWYAIIPEANEMSQEIERRLSLQSKGTMLPFTVMNNKTKKVLGLTSFCHIDSTNRRLDIGWTWYAKSQQRTGLNTICKLMLLQHAFETLDAIAVGFRVDNLNRASQKAVERIGARYEGTIRNYHIMKDGHYRDMVFYSILPHEWPRVKSHLENLINVGESV